MINIYVAKDTKANILGDFWNQSEGLNLLH